MSSQNIHSHNIVIFGEVGCGKSSLVNMIVGENVAKVSSELLGCTLRSEAYDATLENTHFRIYDTAGLNEGDQGRVPHWTSVKEIYTLIRKLDSVSLLIYCARGIIKENSRVNWILFNDVICGEQVPTVAVVTGLENERDWDDQSKMKKFRTTFESYDIKPEEITTVISIKGKSNEFEKHYDKSQQKLREMIAKCRRKEPWSRAKDEWFTSIYHTTYTTQLCFFSRTNVDFIDNMRTIIQEFTQATSMSEAESKELQDTLLKAEKKVLEEKGKVIRPQRTSQRNSGRDTPNVVIFGQTGAGKSSLVNMLAGSKLAEVFSESSGGTSTSRRYEISSPSMAAGGPETYAFWDTPGLNQGEFGTVNAHNALKNLLDLAQVSSIHLVIYCIRAETFTKVIRINYDLFWGIICERRVPIVLVVTGLEQEVDMDAWWKRNEKMVLQLGITSDGHACVTTTKGRKGNHEEKYAESAKKVWKLVMEHCGTRSWRMSPERSAEVRKRLDACIQK